VLHKYVALRKKVLGLEALKMHDVYVPLVELPDTEIPYEEALQIMQEGLAPLGEDYIARVMEGVNAGWIDVYENEGKTSISVNLALALAQNGHKVLLADFDMRNPSIHNFFKHVPHNDEQNVYNTITSVESFKQSISFDETTGLWVAFSSSPCTTSTSDKFGHHGFVDVIDYLKQEFDYIIIDTSPCGLTVGPEIMSNVIDACLLVIRHDHVYIDDINDCIEMLSKCYMAGCILNRVGTFKMFKKKNDSEHFQYYSEFK
jgi:capsular exopolysaccharide synthesis family protein